jgi:hypothetical protein
MTTDPSTPAEAPKSDYDSPWKEALERFFPEFLALLFPAIHARIDWRVPPEFLDKELQQIGAGSPRGRRYADKLVRVQARDGQAGSPCSSMSRCRATPKATLASGCFSTRPGCVIATVWMW